MTRELLEASATGNAFIEHPMLICRLDMLARNLERLEGKLNQLDLDVVICDEAHKMSASFFGGEVKTTKRYRLGQLLGSRARHLLLLTATPHNGKEEDFQLFMALLDSDRFEGRFRDGVHIVDTSDMMRRMVKEQLLRFDGRPLFPERLAYTVNYQLSDEEAHLYQRVTDYVRQEMNRAERFAAEGDEKRKVMIGFALTILQRRLASSPEAIYQSLTRRLSRLEKRLNEEKLLKRGLEAGLTVAQDYAQVPDVEDVDDLIDETPSGEIEAVEEEIVDRATASRTIAELEAEIITLKELEGLALKVKNSGKDRKWEELSKLLQGDGNESAGEMFNKDGLRHKLIIFTEHRDTLNYLAGKIRSLIGRPEAVVVIHGSVAREERRKIQESFAQDKEVMILVATDAAGEGINLQKAHLMINYDLPWNPNRIEQRFGRIHRIGQTEVCHLWNLVASETREGAVFERLFSKLETQRKALGGSVFNVLGKCFTGNPLRELIIEAIRYGDDPEVKEKLFKVVDSALDFNNILELIEERALTRDTLQPSKVKEIRDMMERAQARRLQPHFIASFFKEAFTRLGGTIKEKEPRRYELTHVPSIIRQRDRLIGIGEAVLPRYERVTFEKELITVQGKPLASFVCPGHPLLDAVIDIVLERHRELLKRGAVLVDKDNTKSETHLLFYLEHSIQDARQDAAGNRRIVSRRMQFIEIEESGNTRDAGYAPYLDYRPLEEEEKALIAPILDSPWLKSSLEGNILTYAVEHLVPAHLTEVKNRKDELVHKTMAAVKERLTKEIAYWDHRAQELAAQEASGKSMAKVNSALARQRCDDLQGRLEKRLEELKSELSLSPAPPLVMGGAIVIPLCIIEQLKGVSVPPETIDQCSREKLDRMAIEAVVAEETKRGRNPRVMPHENPGYDIESRDPETGRLIFIEVKGKQAGSTTVTISKTQILTALNKPDDWILALVEVESEKARTPIYMKCPFTREPDFATTSVNFDIQDLLSGSRL